MTSKSPTSKSRKISIKPDPQPSPNPVNSLFSDLDTNDSHIVQDTLLNADWSGGALTPAQENDVLDQVFVIDNDGNWSFNGDLDLDFLAVGESITLTYEITVSDGNGLPATQNPLTVTLTGTNDQPVIDVQIPDFQVQEDLDQAGPTTVAQSGQLLFSDLDTNDSHIVVIGHWSFNGDLERRLVRWRTLTPDAQENASRTSSSSTTTATGPSTAISISTSSPSVNPSPSPTKSPSPTATAYPPLKTHSPSPSQAPTTSRSLTSKSPTSKSRKISIKPDPQPSPNPVNSLFSDLDTNDSHIVQDTLLNADWSGGALTPAQENALDLFVIDNDGNWSFNGDLDLDFLAVGESITLTYEITVSDGNGLPATQNPLTVTLTGTNDQPVIDVQIPDFQVQEDLDQVRTHNRRPIRSTPCSLTSIPTTHTSSRTTLTLLNADWSGGALTTLHRKTPRPLRHRQRRQLVLQRRSRSRLPRRR